MENINQALLSIVVPVYNVEKYLDRCVESIVNQTYTNLEIILVDDGSPDRCPWMCDEWVQKDSRIRVIHKQNGGAADSRNVGIEVAKGTYIAFVDSDDYIALNMYEIMIEAMQRNASQIACCARNVIKKNEIIEVHCINGESVFNSAEAIRNMLLGEIIDESPCDKVYEKRLFQSIRFPNAEINEDIVVMPLLIDACQRIVHVGVPLYNYWQNSESVTRSSYSPKKRIMLKHLDDLEKHLKEKHRELLPYFDSLQCRYCQSVLYLLLDNAMIYREYRADYEEFYQRFKKSFKKNNKLRNNKMTEIIKGYLIYYKIYYYLHWIIKHGKKKIY